MRYQLISILLLFTIFGGCQKVSKEGFYLERFQVTNVQLDSLLLLFGDKIKTYEEKRQMDKLDEDWENDHNRVPILIFSNKDSLISIDLVSIMQNSVNDFIFRDNYRILGYIKSGTQDFIFLAESGTRAIHITDFFELTQPVEDEKQISYIYYPRLYYKTRTIGTDTITGFTVPISDYRHFGYRYYNGDIYPNDEFSIF